MRVSHPFQITPPMEPINHTTEFITLGIYLAVMISLGVIFSRFNKNLSDYVRGGGQGTWWMVGSSILMSGISAFTFTGNVSAVYDAGWTPLVIYVGAVLCYLFSAWFLGAWLRQSRAYTVPDVIRARFGTGAEQFFVYAQALLGPLGSSIQLWALAVFTSSVYGYPLGWTIIIVGCIVVGYSTVGGRWAVLATDFTQSLLIFAITILVFILAMVEIGGFAAFFSYFSDPRFVEDYQLIKEPGQFPDNKFTWHWVIVIALISMYEKLSLSSAHRYLAVKDGREASRAALFAAGLLAIGTIIWFMPAMVCRFLYQDELLATGIENPANASYAFIAGKLLPNGLMGIMIAAMFSATMSSMDTGLNNNTGIIVRNLIGRIRERLEFAPLSDKKELLLCKLVTLILGIVIISFSLLFSRQKDIILFDAYLIIASIIGVPLGFPLLVGLWVKRLPSWSYFFIFGVCMIPSVYAFIDTRLTGAEWEIQDRGMWILIAGVVATLICVLFRERSSEEFKERERTFFKTIHSPVDYLKEIGASQDQRQLLLMGNTITIVGALLLILLIIPNGLWGRVGVVFIGTFVMAVGVLLKWGAHIEKRKARRLAEAGDAESDDQPESS